MQSIGTIPFASQLLMSSFGRVIAAMAVAVLVCHFDSSLLKEKIKSPLFVDAFGISAPSTANVLLHPFREHRKSCILKANREGKLNESSDLDPNPITKASWYAVEWFGQAFGRTGNEEESLSSLDLSLPPKSIGETLQRIQQDNDRSYFLSGAVDEQIYDVDCTFRDPFVSFDGRERFVTNLANLGSFITKYDAKVLEYNQPNETTIQTKIMVKLELNLPWKPILAWPWGVTYTVDPDSHLIVDHAETWDIEAWEGVKQIFRKPTLKL